MLAPNKAEARKRMADLAAGLALQFPESMTCLEGGIEAATKIHAFPEAHWHRVRSTNGLEGRKHPAARTNAVGAFPDRSS